jgi:hypothetical protein
MSKAKNEDAVPKTADDSVEQEQTPPETDRRSTERRDSDDRRAFWRPTPDRRREQSERGRRADEKI